MNRPEDILPPSSPALLAAKQEIDEAIQRLNEAVARAAGHYPSASWLRPRGGLPAELFAGRKQSYTLDERAEYFTAANAKLASLRLELRRWTEQCEEIEHRLYADNDLLKHIGENS